MRGIQNFEFAFQLAKDLGIKKACVLIDSPSDPAVGEENKVKEVLEKNLKVTKWYSGNVLILEISQLKPNPQKKTRLFHR